MQEDIVPHMTSKFVEQAGTVTVAAVQEFKEADQA